MIQRFDFVKARGRLPTSLVILCLMLAAAALALHFTPHTFLADQRQKVQVSAMVPMRFGTWRIDPSVTPLVADPSQLELIDRLYSETLSRTYVNDRGQRIMLVIAYGRDQSESLQLHTPEFCYPAQGFKVTPSQNQLLSIGFKDQPVVRLQATGPGRVEPITYWVTMGDHVVNAGPRARRNVRFEYGFKGLIPDGLLFRVSSNGADVAGQYKLQGAFLNDLFASLPLTSRDRLAGIKVQ